MREEGRDSDDMDAAVRYSILGTVRAVREGRELEAGPPKRVALLALLLLRAPGPVALSEAVEVLWADAPPASAVNVVHRHIGELRRALEPGLRSRTHAEHLVRAADGYRLLVDASTSDLLRFRGLRTEARQAAEAGEPARAARLFLEATGLWRGPVVAAGTRVARHPLFTSVGHEFVATVKEAADLILSAAPASAEELLTALRRAVDGHPLDEALHSRVMAALAATGRQAEALSHYEVVRHTLATKPGVEPGPVLRAARQDLLGHGAPLDSGGPAAGSPPGRPVARAVSELRGEGIALPGQLPPDSVAFAGRRPAVERCMALLPPPGHRHPYATTAVICGMPGVGKTALAVRWAHEIADRFPDGQVHLDLRGHDPVRPPLSTQQAMREVLYALDISHPRLSTASLTSLYRSALAGLRLLVLLDDARDCEQVRGLLPATPGALTVVTSRRRLEGLAVTDDAQVVPLGPMSREEGLELLDRRLGSRRTHAEPVAAREIVDLCAGLPLALALTAARAAVNPTFSLAALAAGLRADSDTLAPFAGPDPRTDLRQRFSRTCQNLSPGAAALFRLVGVHAAADITVDTASGLTGTAAHSTRQHLAELVDHHLLTEEAPGRYACHGLLRVYANELGDGVVAPVPPAATHLGTSRRKPASPRHPQERRQQDHAP
ncbi:BTAD domain-containing putative transcriptional regulator [Streptomyces sp. BBFR51]|uniref:AfsR/SARP family transcriptional regulator n=1 Tax=Streptomyces sp. BBFR51 TaxID=3372856 RepID=UPI0037DD9F97